VAITRAKQNLTIHLNTPLFDNYFVENLEWIDDNALYEPPDEFIMQLTFRDIWLDYFAQRQHLVDQLISGQVLGIHEEDALSFNGQPVLKFSRQYLEEIASLKNKNYFLKSAKVNAIVYWLKEGSDKEIKIVLPELCFIRRREG
jgi:ATP-dependent DNA helicase RecQ